MREPLSLRGFRRFWVADAVGSLGLAVTAVAVDVLVISVLHASEEQVGLVRAAQFLPYLAIGLFVGVYVDRWRRRPTLVLANLAQALLLLAIPALYLLDALSLWSTVLVLFALGCCAVVTVAAEQSYVPDLVPPGSLVLANARIGQASSAAQSVGPVLGGALVAAVTAPFALLVSSLGHVASAGLVWRIRRPEPQPSAERSHLRRDLGALAAPRAARRLGEGRTIVASRVLCGLAWAATALAPADGPAWLLVVFVAAAQLVYGFSIGVEDPSEMALRQAATPRGMLGRVNATLRSGNRSVAVLGALLGGVLAGALGNRATLLLAVGVFAVAVAVAVASPLRSARSG